MEEKEKVHVQKPTSHPNLRQAHGM